MNHHLFHGQLVRLAAANSETDAEAMACWARNTEYSRMLDSDPAITMSVKQARENTAVWLEHERPDNFGFTIRTLADDRLIGFVGLDDVNWMNGDCFVGIGIGEPQDWGKGYGTDAMRVILRYAFTELNLHRVSLNVFEYNPRGIRSYEKAGFSFEGRLRETVNREGRRWDEIFMGILREEWERKQKE